MRRTKIIATLGPATDSPEMLGALLAAGLDIARLNMSHAPHDWVRRVVLDLRAAAVAAGRRVGILMDTQGPAIRTGDLPAPIDLVRGQKFTLTVRGERIDGPNSVEVNYDDFVNDVSVGDTVVFDNGTFQMKVVAKFPNHVECEVLTSGRLGSRRHINLPGVKVNLPALTDKDRADIALGLEVGVDFIALSFVREAADLKQLRKLLTSARHKPLVIAKIEDQQAVANFDDIAREADAVMVARGDLGIECPYEELPIIQRRVVKTCVQLGRPVIVATHMLESMIESPSPTRAEITDVANAVFEQTDAIMLSGETTVGKYPLKCMEVFDRIARRIERSGSARFHERAEFTSPRQKLVHSAVVLADQLKADALVVFTIRGNMARHAASCRPRYSPILAICEYPGIADSLALNWGVEPHVHPFDHEHPEATVETAMRRLVQDGRLRRGQTTVIISSITAGDQIIDVVEMRIVA
ncbi:MAG: pyruvate kinase [Verrucomicrobiota bacterium]|jgi:pyruvate kinase